MVLESFLYSWVSVTVGSWRTSWITQLLLWLPKKSRDLEKLIHLESCPSWITLRSLVGIVVGEKKEIQLVGRSGFLSGKWQYSFSMGTWQGGFEGDLRDSPGSKIPLFEVVTKVGFPLLSSLESRVGTSQALATSSSSGTEGCWDLFLFSSSKGLLHKIPGWGRLCGPQDPPVGCN